MVNYKEMFEEYLSGSELMVQAIEGMSERELDAGQKVWQTLGGMEVGSVCGHDSYVAPDWTADWLHREAVFILGN